MALAGQIPELRTLYLYLTEGCNCACRHCWIVNDRQSDSDKSNAILGMDVLRTAIEQARPLGLASLKWTGGEPTLHPNFSEFLQLQHEFGLSGAIETNGMLVTEELADLMMETGINQVSVSLDSADAVIHDAIRGVTGGFNRTVTGIKELVSSGFRPELILTLQRSNNDRLQDFFSIAEQLGAGSVKLNILQPVLRGATLLVEGEALNVEEILGVKAMIEETSEKQLTVPVKLDLPLAFRPLPKIMSGEDDGVCAIHNILGVLPHGKYALCGVGQHVPELSMGDVCSVSLEDIWSSHPVLHYIREGLPKSLKGICSKCLMQSVCKGSCVAANYQLSGDLLDSYWFCEQADALGLFPDSRRR
jgi:SynChlorMet cassette radical SAM/SPASM protein ScmF